MQRTQILFHSAVLALLGGAALAQQQHRVLPWGMSLDTKYGGWRMPAPFSSAPSRMQQIITGEGVAKVSANIQAISLRGTHYGKPVAGLNIQQLRVDLGYAATSAEQMSTNYIANRVSGGTTTVLQGKFVLPGIPPQADPSGFPIQFPLKSPFVYTVSKGDLLLDIRNDDNYSYGGYRYELDSSKDIAAEKILFGGCGRFAATNSCAVFEVNYQRAGATLGQGMDLDVFNLPQAMPTVAVIGTSRFTWAGQSLPLDLGFMGASPGSKLWTSVDLVLPMQSYLRQQSPYAQRHAARISLQIPKNPAFGGLEFYTQTFSGPAKGEALTASGAWLQRVGQRLPATQLLFSPWTSGNGFYFGGSRGGGGQYMFGGAVVKLSGTFL